jgi:hypothetical protein
VRIDRDATSVAQFEVKVGDRRLGIAGVTHPSDHLTGSYPGPDLNSGSDSVAPTVIGARGVVVEVEIYRDPTVVVAELQPAALGARSVDFFHHTVRHSDERGEPGGHDVNPEMSTRPTVASLAEDRSDLAAQNGKQHPVEKAATTGWGRRGFDRWSRFGRRQHRAIGRSRSGWWRLGTRQGRKIGDRGWATGRLGSVSGN